MEEQIAISCGQAVEMFHELFQKVKISEIGDDL